MYDRTWILVTILLCLVFAVLAFPILLREKGFETVVLYTLIGFAVIWFAYLARAWVFLRPGFWKDRDDRSGSE